MFRRFRAAGWLVAVALPMAATAEERRPERWYQAKVAEALGGSTEVRVPNGRVDVLTETHAIEVEFAPSWKHSIGQALWYALQTGKEAGIVVVIRDDVKDRPHVVRLGSVIESNGLKIRVWLWPDDFDVGGEP